MILLRVQLRFHSIISCKILKIWVCYSVLNVPMYLKQVFLFLGLPLLMSKKIGFGNNCLSTELLSVGYSLNRLEIKIFLGNLPLPITTIILLSRLFLCIFFPLWPSLGLIWRIPKPYSFHWGSTSGNPLSGTLYNVNICEFHVPETNWIK